MELKDQKQNGICVVTVDGDLANYRLEHKQYLESLLYDDTIHSLLIDFKEASFIMTRGLGLVMELAKKSKMAKKQYGLCNLNSNIKMIFNLTRMDTMLQIYDSRRNALETWQPENPNTLLLAS